MNLVVLGDTGSSHLSLNFPNDFILLGYQPGDIIPVETAEVVTANGKVFRNITSVQINFKDSNGAYMAKWQISECLLNPGLDDTRLPGIYIRNNLYTATVPDGTGRLYFSAKKMEFVGRSQKSERGRAIGSFLITSFVL